MKEKIKIIYIGVLSLFIFIFFAEIFNLNFIGKNNLVENINCVSEIRVDEVVGNSMEGIVSEGERVEIYLNYYICNEIVEGDLVIIDYRGRENYLLKIIKAVPGDEIEFAYQNSGWLIIVNGKALVNSEGIRYTISNRSAELIKLYVNDYYGIIPEEAYLVLGNDVSGTLDSTKFGLINKVDIVGKAVTIR